MNGDTNIIGKSHLDYVKDQIKVRQKILGQGTGDSSRTFADITWMNTRNAWVRLASSVDIANQDILYWDTSSATPDNLQETTPGFEYNPYNPAAAPTSGEWKTKSDGGAEWRARYLEIPEFSGNELAASMVLQGGTLNSDGSQKFGVTLDTDIYPDNKFNYGFGGTDFGLQAMPGILSFESNTYNRGALRMANVQIRANNKKQFEYIEALYLRVGYTMLLEWGNANYPYLDGDDIRYESNNYTLTTEFLNNPPQNAQGTSYFYSRIEQLRKTTQGNYDGFLGRVTNFSWEFTKEGYYLINLKLITIGSVVESLKINTNYNNFIPKKADGTVDTSQKSNSLLNVLNNWATPLYYNTSTDPAFFSPYTPPFGYGWFPGIGAMNALLSYTFDNTESTTYNFKATKSIKDILISQKKTQDAEKASARAEACFAVFGTNKFMRYIRFGLILDLLNQGFLIYGTDDEKEPILFRIDTVTPQYCFSNGLSMSSDPTKFIIRYDQEVLGKKIQIFNEDPIKIEPFHDVYSVKDDEGNESQILVGNIQNVYFSYEFVEQVILNNTDQDTNSLDLFSFLKSLVTEINIQLGGVNKINFRLVDKKLADQSSINNIPAEDVRTQVLEFYDEVSPFEIEKLRNEKSTDPNLVIYGFGDQNNSGVRDGSFVTEYNFKTEISKNLQTMISVGAQANGQSVGEDATLFSKWNYGLVDRILPQKLDTDKVQNQTESTLAQYLQMISLYTSCLSKFEGASIDTTATQVDENILLEVGTAVTDFESIYQGYGFPSCQLLPDNDNPGNSLAAFPQTQRDLFNKYYALDSINQGVPTPFIGFIPINFDLTIDGLSGVRIFDRLKIDSRFLPPNYGNTLDFIITKLDHKIVNNKWYTSIGTMSIPKLFGKKLEINILKGLANLPPSTVATSPDVVGYFVYDKSTLGNMILNSAYYKQDNPGFFTGDTYVRNTNGTLIVPGSRLSPVSGQEFYASPLVEIGKAGGYITLNGQTSTGLKFAKGAGFNGTDDKGTYHLAEPAASALFEFAKFIASQGKTYQINSAYRSFAEQQAAKDAAIKAGQPGRAAEPGSSPHGLGGAIDIQELIARNDSGAMTSAPNFNQVFRSLDDDYKWWEEHAPKYGWYNPQRLRDGIRTDESWHWEFWGTPGQGLQIKPPLINSEGTISTLNAVADFVGVTYLGFGRVPTNNALAVHGYDAKIAENGTVISFKEQ